MQNLSKIKLQSHYIRKYVGKCVKMAEFALIETQKLISRKIRMIENLIQFPHPHCVFYSLAKKFRH